jgi:Tfp pilus assembly protein PilO
VNQRTRLILAAVAAVLVCLLFFMFFIRPRKADLGDVNADIESALNERQSLQLQLEQLESLQERAPRMTALLDEIRGLVPESNETGNFINQVQVAANMAGVEVHQFTPELPKQPPEGAPLAEIRVTIRATGGYFSLQDFVRRLYALDRALRIDTMLLSRLVGEGADSGDIEMTATARVFFEIPPGSTPGGAAATAPPAAPATEPPADPAAEPPATESPAPEATEPAP